jgi:hypothetical protein
MEPRTQKVGSTKQTSPLLVCPDYETAFDDASDPTKTLADSVIVFVQVAQRSFSQLSAAAPTYNEYHLLAQPCPKQKHHVPLVPHNSLLVWLAVATISIHPGSVTRSTLPKAHSPDNANAIDRTHPLDGSGRPSAAPLSAWVSEPPVSILRSPLSPTQVMAYS